MTVDRGQADVASHRHPSGAVLFTLPVEAFGRDPDETLVEWSGGYLTPDLASVTLGSESQDDEEWFATTWSTSARPRSAARSLSG